jgi:hypothetical protein
MFRLALALGMTVAELEQRMSASEISEWIAYDSLEPIGAFRTDYGFAMLAALYVNAHRTKGSQSAKVSEFMPWLPKAATKANDPEKWIAMLKALGGGKPSG